MKRPAMRPEMPAPTRPMTNKTGEVRELTEEDLRLFKPIDEVDPGMAEAIMEFRRKIGRPKARAPRCMSGSAWRRTS